MCHLLLINPNKSETLVHLLGGEQGEGSELVEVGGLRSRHLCCALLCLGTLSDEDLDCRVHLSFYMKEKCEQHN